MFVELFCDLCWVADKLFPIQDEFRELVSQLAAANFACFEANMEIIELRRGRIFMFQPHRKISALESQARRVGEERVRCKNALNRLLQDSSPIRNPLHPWVQLFTFGDCLDRLTIEAIKQDHFLRSGNTEAFESSKALSDTVQDEMRAMVKIALSEGCYETHVEQRTYKLE
jgi:hypothetical protein